MTSREDASLEQRWQAYQSLARLRDHWYWRPGWNPDRRFYTWHLTFDGQPELHDLVRRLQQHLDTPDVDLVPIDGLHLTMQGLGFTDEVSSAHLETVIAAARQECGSLTPFQLHLGPVDPDEQGVGLLVRPWEPVERLRRTIRAAIASVQDGEILESEDDFRPHVTIAYSAQDADPTQLRERLSKLRDLPAAVAEMRQVQLIELRRAGSRYVWDVAATVALGGG